MDNVSIMPKTYYRLLLKITFRCDDPLAVQTLYAQEMLSRGFLVGEAVYTTFAYDEEIINMFIRATDESFYIIKSAIQSKSVKSNLKRNIINSGFTRLT